MQGLTVLVVDELVSFREAVCGMLHATPFPVVGEPADGRDAVQMAKELQPDLIVLGLGLPQLNGLETAKRLRTLAPQAKLLFLSQESCPDAVREAFDLGASGYLHKSNTSSDLLPAIEAVLRGEPFVSKSLEFSGRTDAPRRHEVQFCSHDSVLLESFACGLATALETGDAAVVLATKSHREGLVQRLKAEGFDVDVAMQQGTYISLDAADTLSTVMVNGVPDRARLLEGLNGFIASAGKASKKAHPRIAVCGECAGLLCALGNVNAAIRLEKAGNDLVKTHNVDILCAYPLSGFHGGKDVQVFQSICREHTAVYSR
jgi:DNA-binding NarL/FixJ family response regulator